MRRRAVVVAGVMLAVSVESPVEAEWIVDVYGGVARTHDTALRFELGNDAVTFSPVALDARSLEAPIYYGYRVGRSLGGGGFTIEGEMIHLKVYAAPDASTVASGTLNGAPIEPNLPFSDLVGEFSISHGVNLLLGNVAWRAHLGSRATWVARAGGGASLPHPESRVRGVYASGYEWGGWSWQLATAGEWRLARRLAVFAEYKFTSTHQRVRVSGGHANAVLRTHHGVVGAGVRF